MSTDAGTAGPGDTQGQLDRLLDDDPADLYENAPCGYLSMLPDGTIVKVNRTLCVWTGHTADQLLRTRLRDLLSVGGQVFHDTHLTPLLRMQGAVREVALDVVRADGSLLPCLVNAVEIRLRDRDMALELTQAAKELLAKRGFDPVLGARPLRRTVQRDIEDGIGFLARHVPLANWKKSVQASALLSMSST